MNMNDGTNRNKIWLRAVIILLVLYFSQLYPYVHFHHSHDDDILPFEISFHPIDIDIEHLPDQHDGEDHHHTTDFRIDWHIVRSHSQSILASTKLIYVLIDNLESTQDEIIIGYIEKDDFIEDQFIPIDPLEIRGPPNSV